MAEAPDEDGGGGPADANGFDAGRRDGGSMMDARVMDGGMRDSGMEDVPGGGMDAPMIMDASIDSPIDSPPDSSMPAPSACPGLPAVFCDGFEDPAFTAWDDQYGTGTRTRVTTSPLWRGTGSLRATGSPGELSAWSHTGLPDLGSDIYIRGYVYVTSGFSLVDIGMLYVGATTDGFGLGVESGGRPYVFVDASSTGVVSSTVAVPFDTWTCVRAHVRVSDTAGVVELFVEGDLAASRSGIDTQLGTRYSKFSVGLTYINPSGGAPTVYLDDVAIGSSPLPCD